MRVLCTATGAPSHGRALLHLVRALSGVGHEVTVVSTEAIVPLFVAYYVSAVPAPQARTPSRPTVRVILATRL